MMLRIVLGIGLAACLPVAVLADCVTPADAEAGLTFRRKDGSIGTVRVAGDRVAVDYVTNREAWTDRRDTRFGIFDRKVVLHESEAPMVGSAPPETRYTFSPVPRAPVAGGGWSGTIRAEMKEVGYGSYMREQITLTESRLTARYTYGAVQQVTLSGCRYAMIPVEAELEGKGGTHAVRWAYFPDLGFGLETRRDGRANGIAALVAG